MNDRISQHAEGRCLSRVALDDKLCTALHKIDSLHETGACPNQLAAIDNDLKSIRDILILNRTSGVAHGHDATAAEMLDLAAEFEGEAKAHVAMGDKAEANKCLRAAYALRKLSSQPTASAPGEPVGWCAYHRTHGWRPDLAARHQQDATAAAMRSIESAAQQGWEIQPLYPFTVEAPPLQAALQKAVSFSKQVAAMDDMRDAPGCAEIARKYQAIFESALSRRHAPADKAVAHDEIVFLREVDAGTGNACWVIGNRTDPDAVAFVMDETAATRRRPSDGGDDVRRSSIEECARHLEQSYPDHAWLNAACAAIRCLGAASGSNSGRTTQTLPESNFTPGDPVEIRKVEDEIDEIVIRRGDVHIEQMSADSWFMGVDALDGSYWQFWFGAKNHKSHVEFRHVEHHHPAVADFTRPSSRRESAEKEFADD